MQLFVRFVFLSLFFSVSSLIYSQKIVPVYIDGEEVPRSLARTVARLTKKDSLEADKFERICKWIIKKKSYDIVGFEDIRLEKYSLKKILKKKRLLCREYTVLLEAMCKQANMDCYIADGYTKGAGHYPYKKYYYQTHEWNVAKLDGRYRITDLTWASGYVKPKISLMGRIKRLLHIPYIPKHWKFIKQLNPYYLDLPPDEQIATHLPVHPMWQLRSNPYSIIYFENEDTSIVSFDSLTGYSFESRIQSFSGKSKEEQLLIHGDEGFEFNAKNNYSKGADYLSVAHLRWKAFAKKKEIPLSEKAAKSYDVLKFSKEAERYLRKFLEDNDGIKKRCFDSLGRKNREVNAFISKRYTASKRKTVQLESKVRINDRSNLISQQRISKKELDMNRKINSDAIYTVRKSTGKSITLDSINTWKKKLTNNNSFLDSLSFLYNKRMNSIDNYKSRRGLVWDSVIYSAGVKALLIEIACNLDLSTNNISHLRYVHKFYDSIHTRQMFHEKSLKAIEMFYNNKFQRYTDSLMRVAMKKINQNKSMIIKIKKYAMESDNETFIYEEQNRRLKYWYEYSISFNRREIEHRREYNFFYKIWNKYAKKEWREFRRYAKAEKECYLGWLKHERYRHRRYQVAGQNGVMNSILLTRRSNVFISDYEYLKRLQNRKK